MNAQFNNRNTWYLSGDGLAKLDKRKHAFSFKWPTSRDNAKAGLMIRESSDGKWVAGMDEDWRAARDFLARRHRKQWAATVAVTGPDGGPVQVEHHPPPPDKLAEVLQVLDDLGALPDDE